MGELSALPNIGKVVEEQLNAVGIETSSKLKELGSEEPWLRIKAIDDSACIHRLYALESAIQGIRKGDLPANKKVELKAFYNAHK
ncbi:MAG: TfoX/Sxy family protein [Candidatus Cryosericum sp.]|nr:TfoX/Sxy family protein [bacterium]